MKNKRKTKKAPRATASPRAKPAPAASAPSEPPPEAPARKALPWVQIETEYVTGDDAVTYSSLARKYGCYVQTTHLHGKAGGWPEKREEHRKSTLKAAQKKTGEAQSYTIAKSIEIMQGLTNDALRKITSLSPDNYTQVMREIRENIKTINMYLGEPTERVEMSGEQRERLIAVFRRLKAVAPGEYEELKAIYGYEHTAVN